jgi:hypothetical protein
MRTRLVAERGEIIGVQDVSRRYRSAGRKEKTERDLRGSARCNPAHFVSGSRDFITKKLNGRILLLL